MFKSITYLRCGYDAASSKYTYYYRLVDSEFECEVSATASAAAAVASAVAAASAAAASAAEYHKRNLPIIKNLYLLNNFMLKEWHVYWSFEELLNYQNQYINKYYTIPGINFSKDIYPKLLKMHKELLAFK